MRLKLMNKAVSNLIFTFTLFLFTLPAVLFGQDFEIEGKQNKFTLKYQEVNNQVVIPVSVNSSEPANFLLDTGSPYTIITDTEFAKGFVGSRDGTIKLTGFGQGKEPVDAYISKGNQIKTGKAVSNNSTIVVLEGHDLELTQRFGVRIVGVIGYDLFKNFIIKVKPTNNKVSFYNPGYFHEKECVKNYEEIQIEIDKKKPYINLKTDASDNSLRLLVDSGNTDSFWIYENENFKASDNFIEDYLGFGLSGEIEGRRARGGVLKLGDIELKNPVVSFPDNTALEKIDTEGIDGSIGSEILKRFTSIYDYKNNRIYFKKNKNFKKKFDYNLA